METDMQIFVLTAEPMVDIAGEIMDSGFVVGVYDSLDLAEASLKDLLEKSAGRKAHDYSIDTFDLKGN
jgi:hypothetical protein